MEPSPRHAPCPEGTRGRRAGRMLQATAAPARAVCLIDASSSFWVLPLRSGPRLCACLTAGFQAHPLQSAVKCSKCGEQLGKTDKEILSSADWVSCLLPFPVTAYSAMTSTCVVQHISWLYPFLPKKEDKLL